MKIEKRWFFVIAVMSASIALAQGTEAEVQQTSLLSLIKTGGWAMWPLGGFSIFMVTLIIQNFMNLRAKVLLHSEQMPNLLDMMLDRKVKGALIYCRKNPFLFANTLGAGLERCLDGEAEMTLIK